MTGERTLLFLAALNKHFFRANDFSNQRVHRVYQRPVCTPTKSPDFHDTLDLRVAQLVRKLIVQLIQRSDCLERSSVITALLQKGHCSVQLGDAEFLGHVTKGVACVRGDGARGPFFSLHLFRRETHLPASIALQSPWRSPSLSFLANTWGGSLSWIWGL